MMRIRSWERFRRLRSPLGACLGFALAVAPAVAFGQAITFVEVADELTPVPGQPGDVFEDAGGDDCRSSSAATEAPALSAGRVVFHALTPEGEGLYLWEGGAISTIADETTEPPGEDDPFTGFDPSPTIDQLSIGFKADFAGGSNRGGFLWQNGTIVRVADLSTASPSTPGATLDAISDSPTAGPGQLAFVAQDDSAEQVEGVYLWNGSTFVVVADESTEPPGQPGTTFVNFESVATDLSGSRVVFWGETQTDLGGGAFATTGGLYLWDGGALTLIADENTPVPGRPGQTFSRLDLFASSFDGNTVVFVGQDQTETGPGSFTNHTGIYAWRDGVLSLVVDQDTAAPGGGTLGNQLGNPSVSGDRVLFEVDCDQLYLVEAGELRRVLGEGDVLDGRTVDDVWGGRQALDGPQLAFNVLFDDGDDGDAVYLAQIEEPAAPPQITEIPTLSQWGLILMALLLGVAALRVVRTPVSGCPSG